MQGTKRKTKPVNFTKEAINGLKLPPVGGVYVYDAKMPGLAICITATGSRTFYVYRKINCKPERILIGRWPVLTSSSRATPRPSSTAPLLRA